MLSSEDYKRLVFQNVLLEEVACLYSDEERWKNALYPTYSITFPEHFSLDDPPEIVGPMTRSHLELYPTMDDCQ